jgi:hypothetical protein
MLNSSASLYDEQDHLICGEYDSQLMIASEQILGAALISL